MRYTERVMTLAEALPIVSALSPSEKLQLIELLAVQVRDATPLPPATGAEAPRPVEGTGSGRLYGILASLGPVPVHHDLDDLAGTWVSDPAFDEAISAQRQIDADMWK